jgi:uncharacterized protein YpmS
MAMVSNMAAATATASLPTASPLLVRRQWAAFCFLAITIIAMFLVDFQTLVPYSEYMAITEFSKDPASITSTNTNTAMTKEDLPSLSNSTKANAITFTVDDLKAFSKNSTTDTAKEPMGPATLTETKKR